jgi:cysteine-rich repeat protein
MRLVGWSTALCFAVGTVAACSTPPVPSDDDDYGPAECGNGIIEAQEECDDGNFEDSDGCLGTCQVASCGDSYLYEGIEQCDDGNNRSGDACSVDCLSGEGCGNGVLDPGEDCDDGNVFNDDGCLAQCKVSGCGDGFAELGQEECDDGNQKGGDGCSATCELGDAPGEALCPGIAMALSLTSDTHIISDTFDDTDEVTHSCGGSGNDAVFAVTPQADGWLIVSLSGMQGGDAVLAIRDGDCMAGPELGCANANGANGTETVALQVQGGQVYYVFADSASTSPINYELGLHLQQEIPGDNCPGIPISLAANATVNLEGDTSVATSDQKGTGICASASSTKDLVYAVTPSHDGTLSIDLAADYDAVLYARVGSCTGGMQVGCSDGPAADSAESLSINAVAGTTYSVVVDGYQGTSGSFELSVNLAP